MMNFWSLSPAGGHGPHLHLAQKQHAVRRAATAAAAGAAVAAAGALASSHLSSSPAGEQRRRRPIRIPRPVIDVLCGAVGEIAQVSVLYPLDTIKVRCQASGSSARAVLSGLLQHGFTPRLLSQLYAGVISTSLCSVAVGSLYYFSFCAAKRMALASAQKKQTQKQHAQRTAGGAACARTDGGAARRVAVAGAAASAGAATGEDAGLASGDVLAAGAAFASLSATHSHTHSGPHKQPQQQQPQAQQQQAQAMANVAPSSGACSALSTSADDSQDGSSGRVAANLIAACSAALVGAVVEAPIELFKHQTQAGLLQGNMLRNMVGAVQASGPAALYTSLVPFCLKSLPFDIGELLTYSQLQDLKESAAKRPDSGLARLLAAAPRQAVDMAIGAAAGAAAVLLSMPSDCVKTVMETSGRRAAGPGLAGSLGLFVATAKELTSSKGPAGLFMGVAPRLCEKVPSTCLYWLAVESCRRWLEPYASD